MASLLDVLKLDWTLFPQLFIFLVAFVTLSNLVFKPYLAAFNQRKEATVGTKEVAEQLALETQEIQFKYETKAKELNSEIKSIFDSARKEATKLQEEVLFKAREEAESLVKTTREQIRQSVARANEDLKSQVPEISQSISNRLIGKEL